jgi:cell division protein FtsW (lipid II flippase)
LVNTFINYHWSKNQIRDLLVRIIILFLFIFSITLTISPIVRNRSLDVPILWHHWFGFITWALTTIIVNRQIKEFMPESDLFLFPITSLLTGWGILTIWRLVPEFGFRQSVWFLLIGLLYYYLSRKSINLNFLKKYKYIWLLAGLSITALTILLGVNPMGGGPRLWLGCCGFYFQPSEPLKLLFIIYLSAYFADRLPLKVSFIALIIPTLIITAIALLILIVQQDLGTALVFIFIFTTLLFIATGRRIVLLLFVFISTLSSLLGYYLFDVVRIRIDSWINPWIDPSGRSYQIVQSLMSISNGGLIGRGPGGGYPNLVPVAISDFIYTSIAEEFGLIGSIAIILLLGIFIYLGLRISLRAADRFQQFLSFGITSYLISQSILIIGGNLRLLPLTGVTLPFVSYGGSSLLTSFIALFILLLVSIQSEEQAIYPSKPKPYLFMGNVLLIGLLTISLANGWWSLWRSPELLSRSDNARRSISDLYVKRGAILSRNDEPINITVGTSGQFQRNYLIPELSPIVGYTHNVYGQAGLEASLDDYLRGLSGQNSGKIIVDNILYGQPPPGLDIRTSINLVQQSIADNLLTGHRGAVILLNSDTGEILVMSSHPNFDPNRLDEIGSALTTEQNNPLLNRAAQGLYPTGNILKIFQLPEGLTEPPLDNNKINELYNNLGFYKSPEIRLPTTEPQNNADNILISPLQLAIASASLTNDGILPSPRLAIGVDNPISGWVILPPLGIPVTVYDSGKTKIISDQFQLPKQPFWEYSMIISDRNPNNSLTWYIAGTLFDWSGTPLTVTVLLEESNITLAKDIGEKLLQSSLLP